MVKFRNYQNVGDLELQRKFWIEVTRELPWAWKPNKSQIHFAQKPNFDPRTKVFAFEGNKLIGYMSCIRHDTFIPFGFPWVQKGFEGDVQEEMYCQIYDLATGPLQGKSFLQRFREEWTSQIEFFENKGFTYAFGYPIYIQNLEKTEVTLTDTKFKSKVLIDLSPDLLLELASKDPRYVKEDPTKLAGFYRDIDFDLILALYDEQQAISMVGVTSREDTHYSELNLVVSNEKYQQATDLILERVLNELKILQRKHVSITLEEDDPIIETVGGFNFQKRSKSVFYSKDLK